MTDELKQYMEDSYNDRMCTMLEMLIRIQFPNLKEILVEPIEGNSFNITVKGDANVSKEEVEKYLEWAKKEFEIKTQP